MKKGLVKLAAGASLVALAIAGFQFANKASAAPAEKISICHATGSDSNPYTYITTKALGPYGANGHTDENGTPLSGHEDDFFPEPGCDCEGDPVH